MGQKDITEKLLEDYNENSGFCRNLWKMQKSTRNIKQKMEKSMNWRGMS